LLTSVLICYIFLKRIKLLTDYTYIAYFLMAAVAFGGGAIAIPMVLRYFGVVQRNPNPDKYNTYECGMETTGKTWIQFNFRYYFYALIFVTLGCDGCLPVSVGSATQTTRGDGNGYDTDICLHHCYRLHIRMEEKGS